MESMVIMLPAFVILQADVSIAFARRTFLATYLTGASAGPTLEWFHFGHVLMLALTAQMTSDTRAAKNTKPPMVRQAKPM